MFRFGRQLVALALFAGAMAMAPSVAHAVDPSPSSGCDAVNGGAWDEDAVANTTTGITYQSLVFVAGETISMTLTASSVGTTGGAAMHIVWIGVSNILSVGRIAGPFPTTVFTGSAIIPANGSYRAVMNLNNQPAGAVTVSARLTCTPAPAACAPGSYSTTGRVPCTLAPPGTSVGGTGATSPTQCPIGSYQPASGSASCLAAPPGSYAASPGSLTATKCAPGNYQPDEGMDSCLVAPPGSYVDSPGAQEATPCPIGQYQGFSGMNSCVEAEPGSYVDTQGAVAPTPCIPGYYQPDSGAGSCVAAQPGYFVPSSGAAAQTPCPPATTSGPAAVACTSVYVFSGFRAPVDTPPTINAAKAGQSVPLKFSVTNSMGAPVTTLTSVSVTVASLACSAGTTTDEVEEYAAGGEGLQNLGGGDYQFNWKTPKSYASSCKTLRLDLGDGIARTALFAFKK